jgi:hypothetical protein
LLIWKFTTLTLNAIKQISRARPLHGNQNYLDAQKFGLHYPHPPEGRRFAVGMQYGGKTTTFVHITHFRSVEVAAEGDVQDVVALLLANCQSTG